MMNGDKLQDGVNSKQNKRILISKILNINQYNVEYKLPLKHSVTACLQETKKERNYEQSWNLHFCRNIFYGGT